jgi:hypothetical protein
MNASRYESRLFLPLVRASCTAEVLGAQDWLQRWERDGKISLLPFSALGCSLSLCPKVPHLRRLNAIVPVTQM